ncbi:hydroxyacid dehydrogenase [Kaistia dalseonensis]|uniref:D-3-phosphoglycerate dehydrogenase n=1 Tax=Kaistia dalseonensis TaxID=410840 RepID=A0ABU0H093_9HYPH|nr:hydroxyacid dehydrogenase [Kaistia dalseonensis]MCX5493174.1 hydroxyacid dehydrogenase [Kaistia dalseonensis]MDQ0435729.1 D-3-phosphoglycerate dehydrogenase [Kaistia dalseonensis]
MKTIRVLMTGDDLVDAASRILEPAGASLETMSGPIDEARMVRALSGGGFDALLVRANPPLSRAVLAVADGLAMISKMGAGVDSVDLAAATERGIPVMTAGDANADATAEMTIALIMALRRNIVRLDGRVKAGIWDRGAYLGTELRGQTLGIIGLGRIGRRVAAIAQALGLRVIASGRPDAAPKARPDVTIVSTERLLAEADIVSLHCLLNPATRGFINGAAIAMMKPGALLVNTARGALINEADVADALRSGRLGGAAFDTLSTEPPTEANPLLAAPNTIITPHIAAETAATLDRMAVLGAENIVSWFAQRSIVLDRLVNRDVLERLTDVNAVGAVSE